MRNVIIYAAIFFIIGCGTEYKFKKANKLIKEEAYLVAISVYQDIESSDKNRAAEAFYREAEIFRKYLFLYPEAIKGYRIVYELYPQQSDWAKKAKLGAFNSPDYFPIKEGNMWIEVDSQTGGKNLRAEMVCSEVKGKGDPEPVVFLDTKYFAGKKLVPGISGKNYFSKQSLELKQYQNYEKDIYQTVLRFPFEKGNEWVTKEGKRELRCMIEDVGVVCKVKAGNFKNCIKISKHYEGLGAITYVYYAPNIGKILVTIKSPGSKKETRNTELSSFKIKD
ncbi:MAG: hypothetical protein ABII27_01045 [bacterium]